MWKKIVGIVAFAISGVLSIVFLANWVVDSPMETYEWNIDYQNDIIDEQNEFIDLCEANLEDVYEYERTYGVDLFSTTLISLYEQLIDTAEDIKYDAYAEIAEIKVAINTHRGWGIAIWVAMFYLVAAGIVLLTLYRKQQRRLKASMQYEEMSWVCPNCNTTNSNLYQVCSCGYAKQN